MATKRTRKQRHHRRLFVEPLEHRRLLAHFGHSFTDISPDNSDGDATSANRASGGRVNGLASVAGDNQTFYAASEFGGIYKSADAGLTWQHLEEHVPKVAWDVEVDPGNTNRVYATSFYDGRVAPVSGIQVSNDAGATWTHPLTAHPDPALELTPNDNTPVGFSCAASRRTEPSAFGIGIRLDAPNNVVIGTKLRSSDQQRWWIDLGICGSHAWYQCQQRLGRGLSA